MPAHSSESETPAGRYRRLRAFYGAAGFARVRRARVIVVGVGGVGSHAALALARSGIGALDLVDADRISASSLNRFPAAEPADVGRPKVAVLAGHLRATCPDTEVATRDAFVDDASLKTVLHPAPDGVIDAIDSLNPKVSLLVHCVAAGWPVISSMGASGRRDFSLLRVGDISETRGCPLARRVRRMLRRRGIEHGITVVYSPEKGAVVLPPDPEEPDPARGRPRNVIPNQISMPGIFGYALAGVLLEQLAYE